MADNDTQPATLMAQVGAALMPTGIVLLLALAVGAWVGEGPVRMVIEIMPAVIFAAALLASLHFNRGRAFFATLTLALAWYALEYHPGAATYHAACLIVPINLILFSTVRERGIFSRSGSLRFLLLFLESLFVLLAAWSESEKLLWILSMPLFESGLTRAIGIAPPGFLAMLAALLLFNGRLFLSPGPEKAAFFTAQLAVILALYDGIDPWWSGLLLGAAALMYLVAVLQTSWQMAYMDQLTGVPGRRALEEQLQRLDEHFVIAMVDVDHFKAFNDTYGHEAGDEVLRMVASRISEVGAGGKAYRYGGEEFTIVFPNKQLRETLAALGALRKRVEEERFVMRQTERRGTGKAGPDDERELSITISIGAAEPVPGAETPHEVIRRADKALYRAKEKGRNQVCR